jgi:hypothetical protein
MSASSSATNTSIRQARRRIDLLAVDKTGCLVVIELKRDDGAHMDLQSLRYAAMVSSMNFGDVVTAYEQHLTNTAPAGRIELWQLQGYLFADTDAYHIRQVGFSALRRRRSIFWSSQELIDLLAGRPSQSVEH